MNTYVAHAVSLSSHVPALAADRAIMSLPNSVRAAALPEGFAFLVEEESGRPLDIVLRYLISKHLPSRATRKWVRNTLEAEANGLKDFWRFLEARGLEWQDVDLDDLVDYRETQRNMISAKTHEAINDKTIRVRVTHAVGLYTWARSRRLYHGDAFTVSDVMGRTRRSGHDPQGQHQGEDTDVRALTQRQTQLLMRSLGPLPSEQAFLDREGMPPARGRLCAELGLVGGLRVSEVADLKAWQILDLIPGGDGRDAPAGVALMLTATKGLVARKVILPVWLLRELELYIRCERAEAIRAGVALAAELEKKLSVPQALFVNGLTSGHRVGREIKRKSMQEEFHKAVLRAKLVHNVVKTDPDTLQQRLASTATFSFHDLRHTFAVWTYLTEKENGNSEPWKLVQALLGHRHLSTTMNTYLSAVGILEKLVSDRFWTYTRSFWKSSC